MPGHHGPADPGTTIVKADVAPDYFCTLGVPLLRGRTFETEATPASPLVGGVSQAMDVRYWPDGTALGRRFRLTDRGRTRDRHRRRVGRLQSALPHGGAPTLHASGPFVAAPVGDGGARRTSGEAAALAADIRRELRRTEPDLFFLKTETSGRRRTSPCSRSAWRRPWRAPPASWPSCWESWACTASSPTWSCDRRVRWRSGPRLNWRGTPMTTFETIVDRIGSTRTEAGPLVHAELDTGEYPTGVKVTKSQMDALALVPDEFHGDWNYKLVPR